METADTAPTLPKKKPHVLINRNFSLLWTGETISLLGDYMFDTTLVIWIALVLAKGQLWAPLAVSGVVLTATLSRMIIGPIAGVFADRWNQRRTMLTVNIVQALGVGLLLLTILPGVHLPLGWQLSLIYVIALLVNISDQFFNQSLYVVINDVVEPADLPQAMGRMTAMISIATIIGPAIAAPLTIFFGPQWALLVNVGSFLVSFGTIWSMRIPVPAVAPNTTSEQRQGFWPEFFLGVRALFTTSMLLILLVADLIVLFGTSSLTTLSIFFVTRNLHADTSLYGLFGAALGVGALVGSLIANPVIKRLGMERSIWVTLFLTGILLIFYARLTSFWPALVLYFLIGIPVSLNGVANGSLVFQVTPRELLARTNSVRTSLFAISVVAGSTLAGYVDSIFQNAHTLVFSLNFGSVDTIFTVAGLLTLAGGIFAWLNLRKPIPVAQPELVQTAASES